MSSFKRNENIREKGDGSNYVVWRGKHFQSYVKIMFIRAFLPHNKIWKQMNCVLYIYMSICDAFIISYLSMFINSQVINWP